MKTWLFLAGVNGFLAVAAGAFAAHGLERRLGADALGWIETAARYHLIHALALLAVAWLASLETMRPVLALAGQEGLRSALLGSVAGWAFLAGILLFCGSLYTMALTGQRALGIVTPFGGLAFLIGWAALAGLALAQR